MKEYLDSSDRKQKRSFIPIDFPINDWESLKPYFDQLMDHSTGLHEMK